MLGVAPWSTRFVGEERRVAPDRLAVLAPETVQRPARQLLAGIPLALAEVHAGPSAHTGSRRRRTARRRSALRRAERSGVPLRAVRIVDRRRTSARRPSSGAHRRPRARASTSRPSATIGVPLRIGVRLRDARRFPDARHRSSRERTRLRLRRRAPEIGAARRRLRRAGERNVPFAGEQARRRVEADPARAGQIHLAPRVQIGEVLGRCRPVRRAASRRRRAG